MSKVLGIDDADGEQPEPEDAAKDDKEKKVAPKAAKDDKEKVAPKGKAKKTGGRGKGKGKGKILTGKLSGSLAKRCKVNNDDAADAIITD